MENDFNYKWSKLFASKRYNTKDGIIQLTPEEQQELLDDAERVVKNCSIPLVIGSSLFVIELSDEELKIVTKDELDKMHDEKMEFDGFSGYIVKGRLI